MISLYRIDDRVIHGQTIVRLLPQYACDGIIIIDDHTSGNPQLLGIYKQVVPDTTKLYCFSIEKAQRKLQEAKVSKKHYIVIFKSILTVKELHDRGVKIMETINVGTASRKNDAKDLVVGFALNQTEIDSYNYLDEKGYTFSILPAGGVKKTLSWKELKDKA